MLADMMFVLTKIFVIVCLKGGGGVEAGLQRLDLSHPNKIAYNHQWCKVTKYI